MEALHGKYGKPVAITEFACQTAAESRADPHKYSQAEVDSFIEKTLTWMVGKAYVELYAVRAFDSVCGAVPHRPMCMPAPPLVLLAACPRQTLTPA